MLQGGREMKRMKAGIHPLQESCIHGHKTGLHNFLSGSTKGSNETVDGDGNIIHLLKVESVLISHHSTLDVRVATADGRVDRGQ